MCGIYNMTQMNLFEIDSQTQTLVTVKGKRGCGGRAGSFGLADGNYYI